jgi:ABC-type branched-subunit amino acid transport system permease subunit
LLAPTLGLDATLLTMLVVQAFGAAAVGGFSNLPLTYGGGLLVGVLASVATKYLAADQTWRGIPTSMPFIVLVVVLLVVPVRRLPGTKDVRTRVALRRPMNGRAAVILGAIGGVLLLAVPHLVGSKVGIWVAALIMVIVFASLSLLVWTSGQISLCHVSFAAFGATTLSHLTLDLHLPWGLALVLAGLLTVPLGALVAIPAIRLSGLYLALTTFGFAVVMQNVIYSSPLMFGHATSANASRPHFGFIDGRTDTGFYYIVLAIAVGTCAVLVAMTRGRLGRLLRALSESPTMLATNGLTVNTTRLIAFCISAFFAGIAGGLMVTQASAVNGASFPPLTSLLWLAVLALCGTRPILSPVLAAAVFALVPAYVTRFTVEQQALAFGVAAVIAAIVVANRASIASGARRYAMEWEVRRQSSPVRARRMVDPYGRPKTATNAVAWDKEGSGMDAMVIR